MKRLEAPIVKQMILKEVKLAHPRKMVVYPAIKRTIDLMLVLFMLPIALPILIIFAILIKLETSGPAFYIQERSGYKGKSFRLYKLRSMGIDAEKNGAVWAIANDPRVTKIGKFIRQTRIDELPQLLNVLKGEMSVVGPRSERPSFTERFEQEIQGNIRST